MHVQYTKYCPASLWNSLPSSLPASHPAQTFFSTRPTTTAALLPARLQHILTPGFYYGNFSHSYTSGLFLSLWAHLYRSPTVTVPYLEEVLFLQLHQLVSDYCPEPTLDLPFVKFPSMFLFCQQPFFSTDFTVHLAFCVTALVQGTPWQLTKRGLFSTPS